MDPALYRALLEAAKILNRIEIPAEVLEQKFDIPEKDWPGRANWCYQGMLARYERSEKDPMMKAIFSPWLKILVALHNTDFTFRQRIQWQAWYLAEYMVGKFWKPDAIQNKEGKVAFMADPKLWGPLILEQEPADP